MPRSFGTYYVLKGKEVVETEDLFEWGRMFENQESRRVARTGDDDHFVSTVFLGIDHGFGEGPPLIFETMAFLNGEEQDMTRSSTWAEAERQHRDMCIKVLGYDPSSELGDQKPKPEAKHRIFLGD